jgi:hypothetical protein
MELLLEEESHKVGICGKQDIMESKIDIVEEIIVKQEEINKVWDRA